MNNRVIITFLAVLTLQISTMADVFKNKTTLEKISNQLPNFEDISCKFTQDKAIPESSVVLKSGGDFKFEKNKGVVFYTTYPVKSTASYCAKEYREINSIIKALSNRQYSKIEQHFDFYFEKQSVWVLGLKPKKGTNAANYLNSIEIEGLDMITKITIITKDKTKTTLRFFK